MPIHLFRRGDLMNMFPESRISRLDLSAMAWAREGSTVVPMNMSGCVARSVNTLRVLVPISADHESRWGVRYAVRRKGEGVNVEVIFLHVGEPVTEWQVLRFRTQREIASFQAERAQFFFEDGSQLLTAEGIKWRGIFRQGELAFTILDIAEELDCDEIVVPLPAVGFARLFSRGVVSALVQKQRDVPVVVIDGEGAVSRYSPVSRTLRP